MAKQLKDGNYDVPVSLKGGSGRAGIASPAPVHVKDKKVTCDITWSSPHYDYMKVDGKKYLKTNTEGNSEFTIPVRDITKPLDVIGDTTAMSKPYEIEYTITFDTDNAVRTDSAGHTGAFICGIIIAAAAIVAIICTIKAKRKSKQKS